jgi:histidinol-phosphate aminotransferase
MDLERLSKINRIRIPDDRNIQGLCMNRNERVKSWDKNIIQNIFNSINDNEWNLYHSLELTYTKLEKHFNLSKDNMLILNGAEDGILKCFHIFVKENSNVAILDPTYAMYYIFSDVFKSNLFKISYKLNKNVAKLDKEYLFSILPKMDIIFLANPNHILDNLNKEDIIKICTIAQKHNTIVVLDEVAAGFGVFRSKELISEFDNLLVINSFSKEYGLPSIRCGVLMGSQKLISACSAIRFSYEISLFSKKAIEYLVDNYEIVKEYNQKVIQGREYFLKELDKLGITYNSDNSICVNVYFDDINKKNLIVDKLKDKNIYVKNYSEKSFNGKYVNFITVSMAPIEIINNFIEELKFILNTI